MPASRKLKVFRTAIGFHDAYVAASSQKAALEAWGTDTNLFARGITELVEDDALAAEPLSKPGVVVKRLRGTAEEQLAALPPDAPKRVKKAPQRESSRAKSAPRFPRPSRVGLDQAEELLTAAVKKHDAEEAEIGERIVALERKRKALRTAHSKEAIKLEERRDEQARAYEDAVADWEASRSK